MMYTVFLHTYLPYFLHRFAFITLVAVGRMYSEIYQQLVSRSSQKQNFFVLSRSIFGKRKVPSRAAWRM